MNKFLPTFFLALTVGILSVSTLSAGFYNGGTMQMKNLSLNVGGTLENNGSLIGAELAQVTCGTFAGNEQGLLKAPLITLVTDVFNYKGTIECSDQCHIYVKEPFDTKMFEQKGEGLFKIVILGGEHEDITHFIGETGLSIDCCLIH